jgi:hypothetical protein
VAKKKVMIPPRSTKGRRAATHSQRFLGRYRLRRFGDSVRGRSRVSVAMGDPCAGRAVRYTAGHNEAVADRERKSPIDRAMRFVPVDAVIRRVDVQDVIDRVDINHLLERVDIDALLDRIDIDHLLERIDVNRIIERVDVDDVVGRVDIDQLVGRTELGGILVQSTGSIATRGLDFVRAQGVGLDGWLNRWVDRILRRKPGSTPDGPPLLVQRSPS